MEKFTRFEGMVVPLDRPNVDTDAIIPKQFLKSIKKTGFGDYLFDEWRFLDKGFPKYGSIQFPCLNNELLTGDSSKCYLNNNLLKRKNFSSWEKSLILTTDENRISRSRFYENWSRLKELNGMCRTWGDCYGYYLLCTGLADVMFDIDLKPYDILPVLPILMGSGIKILDLSEKSDYTTIVACKPEILSTITEIFR